MKAIFMSKAQTMLHGDLHSGSVMLTEDDTRVIDPEFAFYGPMGFDVGALLANLLIAYIAQPGLAGPGGDRTGYAEWILATVSATWNEFEREFRHLWQTERSGALYSAEVFSEADSAATDQALTDFVADIFADALGFAAAKMMRRVIGAAHVEDLESISDASLRAAREKQVIALSRELLGKRHKITTIDELVETAREFLPAPS
jgi:5-methylthioribose kinase